MLNCSVFLLICTNYEGEWIENGFSELPGRYAATRWLSLVPPAVDTTGTAEADRVVLLYSAVPNRSGQVPNLSESLGSGPPEPLLARPHPCCTAELSL